MDSNALLLQAQQLLQTGHMAQAESICRRILISDGRCFHALHLLGIAALQRADFAVAQNYLEAAIEVDPNEPAAHSNVAIALLAQGRCSQALPSCDHALALNPAMPNAWLNRGDILRAMRRPQEAVTSYEKALTLAPMLFQAHFGHGNALADAGLAAEALQSFDRALSLDPANAHGWCNRGLALFELNRFVEALQSFDESLARAPTLVEAISGRGSALKELGRFSEAVRCFETAASLRPRWSAAHNNLGNTLIELDHFDAALAEFDAAIAISPDCAEYYCNRGVLHRTIGQVEKAAADFSRAITIRPDFPAAHDNLAKIFLLQGDFANGWREYEWRRSNRRSALFGAHRQKRLWLGEKSLAGSTILLHAEQGLGDTIQFCRYAQVVAGLGARVILQVQNSLTRLLTNLPGVELVIGEDRVAPDHDFQCALMSLPLACRTSIDTIPADVPYLCPDGAKREEWQRRLGARVKPRVGLVWSGGYLQDRPHLWQVYRRRNIPLRQFAVLADPRVEFYSLQKGEPAESELAEVNQHGWDGPRLIDYTDQLSDFSDTAALVEQLDLVIAVDTSTAHLAGALGKPVWILNRFDGCWRWRLNRRDSPWYPTARLYNQTRHGDWSAVIEQLRNDLSTSWLASA